MKYTIKIPKILYLSLLISKYAKDTVYYNTNDLIKWANEMKPDLVRTRKDKDEYRFLDDTNFGGLRGNFSTLLTFRGILKKMHINLKIMSNDFNGQYGPYSMNITNTESINSLENYEVITLSPELTKKDYEDILTNCNDNSKVEILVQGSVELMKTRYGFKENIENASLIDRKDNLYPIHESLSGEELIIFNSEELSLITKINELKSFGCINFSIDGRYKDKNYKNIINIYKSALNDGIIGEISKYSPKNTVGNY